MRNMGSVPSCDNYCLSDISCYLLIQVRDILEQIRTTLGQTTESVETMRARVSQSLQG